MPEFLYIPVFKCTACNSLYLKGYFAELHAERCGGLDKLKNFTLKILPGKSNLEIIIIQDEIKTTYGG